MECLWAYFSSSWHAIQHWTAYTLCRQLDAAMLSCQLCMDGWLLSKHTLAPNQAAPLPSVWSTNIVIWRREYMVVAIERLLATLPKDDTNYSGRQDWEMWETVGYTSKRWYSLLRETRLRYVKQDNIWIIEQLEAQKSSCGKSNESPQYLQSFAILFILFILVCLSICWTGYHPSLNNIPQLTNSTSADPKCLHFLASLNPTCHLARWLNAVVKR